MRDLELESEGYFESENLADPELELESLGEGFGDHESLGEGFGDGEGMFESEWETEGAFGEGPLGEFENEQFLGPLVSGISSLLGESEFENEGEQFFKKIGSFFKKALPVLKKVAKVAAPIVGTAIGGPLGGKIGSMAGKLLGEAEYEGYYESEFETESEAEMEAVLQGPMSEQQAIGELMAAAAAKAVTDMEAEAQIGSAIAITLSPADRDALRAVLPSINRGVAVLTRILRRDPLTRPAVRVIPAIVKRSCVTLRRQAAGGRPITRQSAARAVANQTRRVLTSPATTAKAVQRNVNATRAAARSARATGLRPRPRQPQRYAI